MVTDEIDSRRRAVLRLAVLAGGVGTAGATASATRPKGRPRGKPPVSARSSVGPNLLVHQDAGTTRVLRRGADTPIFDGPAGAAIQHAVEAGAANGHGSAIALAPGTYALERTVELASATWLAGNGVATTLRAAEGLHDDVLRIPGGTDHVRVSDLRIEGNREGNDAGAAVRVVGPTWRPVLEHLVVRDSPGHGVAFVGGQGDEYSYEPVLDDLDVARCRRDGFVVSYTGDLLGVDLYAEACEEHGFTLADAGGTIVHAHAYDTRGEAGVRILESAKDLTLLGLHGERNRQHGVVVRGTRVAIRGAFVANNSRDAPGRDSGLVLDGARDSLVTASRFVNDPDHDATQGVGVAETADNPGSVVANNLFRGNATAAVHRVPGASTRFRDNVGYRTTNGGTTTARTGTSFPHGLDEAPTRFWADATDPGTYAHVVDADQETLTVEVLDVKSGQPVEIPVTLTWEATAE